MLHPKGRGDRACRDFQKGNCSKGDKCPYSHKVGKPAAPAIKVAATSTTLPKQKKAVSFSTTINTKTYVIPVHEGKRWRTPKDPYQRHRSPRLCDPSYLKSPDRIENIKAQTEAAIAAGELFHEVATRRRFKSKRAWAGPGVTWIVQYNKQSDSVVHDIVKSEFKTEPIALASVPDDMSGDGENSGDNDHEGHQWIMDTGCGSDLISKAKVEDHNLRRSKAKNPIQFQTANGNTKGLDIVTMNIVEFDESVEPYVLPDTPSVLSIGRRCMQEGYHFVWLSGKHPYLITPSGKLVALAVEDDIPYHISGDPRCQPVEPTHELSIPCLLEHMRGAMGDDSQPAVPAEPKDPGDEMIEAAIRSIEADDEGPKPPVSVHPVGEQDEGRSNQDESEVAANEEDPGVVLVDENNGAPVKVPKRKLKEEAVSMAHLISHRFKNPYCQACVRGKMRHLYTKKGAFQRELKEWGDVVTLDFVFPEDQMDDDFVMKMLTVKDIFTNFIGAYPVDTRSEVNVRNSLKFFAGDRKIKLLYGDNAEEFEKAAETLEIPFDNSVPNRKQTNAIVERTNLYLEDQVATCLVAAGFPPCYWEFALKCYTLLHNAEKVNGQSPWELTFGEEFQGKRIPFGALVNFKPTSSRKLSTKFGPDAVTGVFAGYITTSGENWRREYLAWPLADFKDADLSIDCEMVPRQLREPIVAERISLVADKITFPLKNEYERVNTTLEGIKDVASNREGPEVLEMVDVDTPKPRLRYVSEGYLHYSEGTAGDGNIYVDDDGYNVKLDKLGRRYRVRSDGVREVPTSRPLGIPPEAWARMSEREKEEAIRTRDAVERKSKAKASAKDKPKTQDEGGTDGAGGSIASREDEFEGYVPDFEPSEFPLDSEAEEVERYARERGVESDTESEVEPPSWYRD